MVLVDTSVWIAHLRSEQMTLSGLLEDGLVYMHPFIAGELACGNLAKRSAILCDLAALPAVARATDAEVMSLIERARLWGRGLGWIDAHLLAAARISACSLWTLDEKLRGAASRLGLS